MQLQFHKYQGTGNDFILVDDRKGVFPPGLSVISHLCNRRFGIGADGLILIRNHPEHDFEMVYYNSDGSQSLCGNGSRCAAHFARHLGLTTGGQTTFLSTDGPHNAHFHGNSVSLQLHDVENMKYGPNGFFINTGSPHHVEFVEVTPDYPVVARGREIRYSPEYLPEGTNVNFVSMPDANTIFVRTYERGVEDETLSCGTGAVACSLAAAAKGYSSPVKIITRGGMLEVSFEARGSGFTNIFLKGPATQVFSGSVEI